MRECHVSSCVRLGMAVRYVAKYSTLEVSRRCAI